MITFTTINILGEPDFILNFKEGYKTLKNIQSVSENWLRIDWNCMKIPVIV